MNEIIYAIGGIIAGILIHRVWILFRYGDDLKNISKERKDVKKYSKQTEKVWNIKQEKENEI